MVDYDKNIWKEQTNEQKQQQQLMTTGEKKNEIQYTARKRGKYEFEMQKHVVIRFS